MDRKVLVVDNMHDSIVSLLKKIGFEANYQPDISRKEILEMLPDYMGLLIRSKTLVDHELISRGQNLKFIGRAGAGLDNIDISAVTKLGIKLINAPEANRNSLGEHTIGMILGLLHRIPAADRQVKTGLWKREDNRGYELRSKTVGIFGYGYMGSAVAERLTSFGCRVLAYDKYKTGYPPPGVEEASLSEFVEKTEILSIHVPLTSETRGLFDYEFMSSFQNLWMVVNTARGEVLKTADLVRMLDEKRIGCAALDVLENERFNSLTQEDKKNLESLSQHENVLLTPHVAGWTYESYRMINEVLVDKISNLKI